jgi:hypothetical protein
VNPEQIWHDHFRDALRAFLRAENARPDDVDVMRAAKVAELALDAHTTRWRHVSEKPERDRKPTQPKLRLGRLSRPPVPREEP